MDDRCPPEASRCWKSGASEAAPWRVGGPGLAKRKGKKVAIAEPDGDMEL